MTNYLIYGADKQLNKIQMNKIIKLVIPEVNEFNLLTFDCTETPLNEIIESLQSYDFFAQKRVVVIRDAWFLTTTPALIPFDNAYDELIECISELDSKTQVILIVDTNKLDTRKKLVKKMSSILKVIKTENYSIDQLRTIISKKIEKEGYSIEGEAITLFLKRGNKDIITIKNNLDKLMLFDCENRHITVNTVNQLLEPDIEDNIFELNTAFLKKDVKKTYQYLSEMKQLKQEPIKLIVMISNQIRLIRQVQELASLKYTQVDIAKCLKVHPFRVKIIFSDFLYKKNLDFYQKQLYDLDKAIINGQTKGYLGLELFFIKNII